MENLKSFNGRIKGIKKMIFFYNKQSILLHVKIVVIKIK